MSTEPSKGVSICVRGAAEEVVAGFAVGPRLERDELKSWRRMECCRRSAIGRGRRDGKYKAE